MNHSFVDYSFKRLTILYDEYVILMEYVYNNTSEIFPTLYNLPLYIPYDIRGINIFCNILMNTMIKLESKYNITLEKHILDKKDEIFHEINEIINNLVL